MNSEVNDKELRKKIKLLDSSFPEELGSPEELWVDIMQKLENRRKQTRLRYMLAAAASVTILIILSIRTLSTSDQGEIITYKTEVVKNTLTEDELFNETASEKAAMNFLTEQCLYERPACLSAEFMELKKELDDVNHVLDEVHKQIELFGADPAIMQAQVSAENQKVYLLKELIQLLRS